MMVIDTSAVLACLLEPERAAFVDLINADPIRLVSVFGMVEASFVLVSRKGDGSLAELHAFLDRADIERVAVDVRRAKMAVEAFRRFGKGQHRAALNIGRLLCPRAGQSHRREAAVQGR
jgi:ribonuclease VapC